MVTATPLPPDAYVPVPIRWRHVVPGDVFVGRDGALWLVAGISAGGVADKATLVGPITYHAGPGEIDPDDTVTVLIPVSEAEAVELTREVLGARLVERRTA